MLKIVCQFDINWNQELHMTYMYSLMTRVGWQVACVDTAPLVMLSCLTTVMMITAPSL